MDLVPEDDVADMRDVFDVMTPEEVRRIKVKRVLEYVMQSPALESIMNVSAISIPIRKVSLRFGPSNKYGCGLMTGSQIDADIRLIDLRIYI
ncbi:hypothetical protein BC938DRAFT_476946, partial [Jimgerdemannia flammicorona]